MGYLLKSPKVTTAEAIVKCSALIGELIERVKDRHTAQLVQQIQSLHNQIQAKYFEVLRDIDNVKERAIKKAVEQAKEAIEQTETRLLKEIKDKIAAAAVTIDSKRREEVRDFGEKQRDLGAQLQELLTLEKARLSEVQAARAEIQRLEAKLEAGSRRTQ
jgi:hypothetical protein